MTKQRAETKARMYDLSDVNSKLKAALAQAELELKNGQIQVFPHRPDGKSPGPHLVPLRIVPSLQTHHKEAEQALERIRARFETNGINNSPEKGRGSVQI